MSFITEEQIQLALEWLQDSADEAAEARANRVYVETYRTSLKSILMKEHGDESGIIQERNAYADPRYIKHLTAIKDAVFKDEKMRFLREANKAKIDAFQTLSANMRGMKF